MTSVHRAVSAFALVIAGAAACTPASNGEPNMSSAHNIDATTSAMTDLAWEYLTSSDAANSVISPSSFAFALGVLAQGASGATAESLDELFGVAGAERSQALHTIRAQFADYEGLPPSIDPEAPPASPLVHHAARVLIVDDHEASPEFIRGAADLGADVTTTGSDNLKPALDAWMRKHTAGLIEESAISPGPGVALIVQDALLFASAWATPFATSSAPLTFTSPEGAQEIRALRGEVRAALAEGEGWAAVRLPYDDALALDVILPAEGRSPEDLTFADLESVRASLDAAAPGEVEVRMPRLDLTGELDLLEGLHARGISFAGGLEKIFPGADLSALVQQVRLEVNARGTVGAAVTEGVVATSAPGQVDPVLEFIVDRPYAARLLDTRTGWTLFLTIIEDAATAS